MWELLTIGLLLAPTSSASEPPPNPAPVEPADVAAATPNVVMPAPVSVLLSYPQGVSGDAVVVLELVIDEHGKVQEVAWVQGPEPFASAALRAAVGWRFSPALRDGVPVSARINFQVEFAPPAPLGAAELSLSQQGATPDPSPPQPEIIDVAVEGRRQHPGARVIDDKLTRLFPGADGDPLRAVEAMPGSIPLVSGGPFVAVRGAMPGKIGYVYDGVRLPYLFHLARGASVLHPWMVSSATLYGGAAPARYGRASGGLIVAESGSPPEVPSVYGLARLTDSALGVASPFDSNRGHAVVAGRYSYTRPMVRLVAPDYALDFWDYQARVGYRLDPRWSVKATVFGAGDTSSQRLEDGRRDYLFNGSFHRANLEFAQKTDGQEHRFALTAGIDAWDNPDSLRRPRGRSLEGRTLSSFRLGDGRLSAGASLAFERARDGINTTPSSPEPVFHNFERSDVVGGLWMEYEGHYANAVTLKPGVRLEAYHSAENPRAGRATALGVEPRLATTVPLGSVELHQAVGLQSQPPSPSQRAVGDTRSVAGGLERTASNELGVLLRPTRHLDLDVTLFHKVFFNTADVEHLQGLAGQRRSGERGSGYAYGAELLLKGRIAERFEGFFAYTLTRSVRSLGRARFSAEFDRRHVLDLALGYDFGSGWYAATRSSFYTGYPAFGLRISELDNAPHTSAYYQVDWRVEKRWPIGSHGGFWGFVVEVLNTTLNREPNGLNCSQRPCVEQLVGPVTVPTLGLELSY